MRHLKALAITAMFLDDDLRDVLVLKGGNALDLVYQVAFRSSADIDLSMEGEFETSKLDVITDKLERALINTFRQEGYQVFDVRFAERPATVRKHCRSFWGGYRVEFKVIETNRYEVLRPDMASLRRHASVVGPRQKRKLGIDISKFEYCSGKDRQEFGDFTIYVYTPEMLMFEKLRAICQQTPEYRRIVPGVTQTARARDFFDIYTINEQITPDI